MQRERKTVDWEWLEISSRKLEIPREYFMQRCHNKAQKWYGPNKSRRCKKKKKKWQKYAEELYKKGLDDPDNPDCVFTHLDSGV